MIYKSLLLRILVCLVFGSAVLSGQKSAPPKPKKKSSIHDIVFELLEIHPNLKVGMESVPSLNDIIDAPPKADASEPETDAVRRVSALIARHSDYECRFHNHWLIIIPRAKKEWYDRPSALRVCTVPAVQGASLHDFLGMVKGARPEEPLTLLAEGQIYSTYEPKGRIHVKQSTVPCFRLLCGIADQLSIRYWRIHHSQLYWSGQALWPLKLDRAIIVFPAPMLPAAEDRK